MTKRGIAALLIAGCSIGTAFAADGGAPASPNPAAVDKAKALFNKYVALEHAFDAAVADLYADDAVIKNKRTYPTGQVREVTFPAPQYKAVLRQAMPLAKQAGDTSRYSDCKYSAEAERIRVTCTRYSERKKYSSPISLLVGRAPKGEWLIFEELSESQP
jgi:ketosteroid isomerase-like protein